MKKLISTIITICFLLTVTPALAKTPELIINNQPVKSDVSPQIIDGRVLVPLRVISESLGALVDWEKDSQTVKIQDQHKTLRLQLQNKITYVNDQPLELDVPPLMLDNRTMVPLRFISEQLGARVSWIGTEKKVIIERSENNSVKDGPTSVPADRKLTNVSYEETEEKSVIEIEVKEGTNKVFELKNPDRIVFDLMDTANEVSADPEVNSQFIDAIKLGVHPGNVTRVVIQLKDRKTTAYEAKQMADKLVVTLTRREAPPPEEGYTHKVVNGQSNVIVIDPGHGGKDVGTVGASGRWEKMVNLAIADKLKGILQNEGFTVVMTREDDASFLSLDERAQLANKSDPLCFISIHANAAENKAVSGLETYSFYGSDKTLANLIHNAVLARTNQVNRKVKEAGFYVIKHTKMPSVLIETGFVSNSEEENFLFNENNQMAIAEGIAEAVKQFKSLYK
ncbi:cell wall hydrolase/autolysin [Desulforamulus reducens MI-1]|uniref:Cell wall hydrolase/autolysin n=1 Tax=Desulforamulus reducens (strain ATCC BAA-1160 / DSM 100696 / MI-1) TaxID=349161 RepID=A4J255_DESRM|nr:N-acetylmuramoyl-L-alanine amidase family protein [Desulforamulus reducens]ABO49158.1 cell wall hydrolase/autolysin [Desulforamulus reducens MI-1]